MKFSIVIPLYNKAPYVQETLLSVLTQTCRDFEVIVVDDGSTDGGAEIVEAINHPRLRMVRQPNAGVSAARNRGIDLAKGEWVTFLDADDLHHPRYLAALLVAQRACPDADLVATDYVPVANRPDSWPPRWPASAGEDLTRVEIITDLPRRWMNAPSVCTSAAAVRASRLRQMQPCFALGESHGEDLDLWFRLGEKSPIALVRTPLVVYRVAVKDSLTAHNPPLAMAPFLQRMRDRALSGAMSATQRRSALWLVAQHEVSLAREALASGDRRAGLRWLIQGRRAATGKRWWLTAAMTLFFPRHLVRSWQLWRVRRAFPSVGAGQP